MTNTAGEIAKAESEPVKIYLGLGSNLGDREANLREAIEQIKAMGITITRESSIYETEPVGYADQPWFLNQVIEATMAEDQNFDAGEVDNPPLKTAPKANSVTAASNQSALLLAALHHIEAEMGRKRNITNGPRLIDIDLLLFGDLIIDQTGSPDTISACPIIPHPRMHLRRFVLEPLCEIAPFITWPGSDKKIADTLAALDDPSSLRLYKKPPSRSANL